MIQILNDKYSNLRPIQPKHNALCVFDIEAAKIAFNYSAIDFVIVLNEKTGKFAYCHNVKECEEFLQEIKKENKDCCPCCKSTNICDNSTYQDNGVIGSGYSRWKIYDTRMCKDCGIIFKPLK